MAIKEKLNNKEKRTQNNTVSLAIWTSLWVLPVSLATFGHEFFWGLNDLINELVILLNFGIGIGTIMANVKHLREMDQMIQKVHLKSMGISLGLPVTGGISYSMLDVTNVLPFDDQSVQR